MATRRSALMSWAQLAATTFSPKGETRGRTIASSTGDLVNAGEFAGFRGNNTGNDALAIQAAIDHACATGKQGVRLPDGGGVFLLETYKNQPQLDELVQTNGEINKQTGKNILRATINPVASMRQSIELKGVHARGQFRGRSRPVGRQAPDRRRNRSAAGGAVCHPERSRASLDRRNRQCRTRYFASSYRAHLMI